MKKRMLGIDPGLSSAGWGILEVRDNRIRSLDFGTIETRSDQNPQERLLIIHREIKAIIAAYQPDSMGIETLFFSKNISSALPVAQARGVVLLAAAEAGLAIKEYSPATIKLSITGQGGALKNQVQEMVRLFLGLPEIPRPDHAADALAVAVCHINHQGPFASEAYDS